MMEPCVVRAESLLRESVGDQAALSPLQQPHIAEQYGGHPRRRGRAVSFVNGCFCQTV